MGKNKKKLKNMAEYMEISGNFHKIMMLEREFSVWRNSLVLFFPWSLYLGELRLYTKYGFISMCLMEQRFFMCANEFELKTLHVLHNPEVIKYEHGVT